VCREQNMASEIYFVRAVAWNSLLQRRFSHRSPDSRFLCIYSFNVNVVEMQKHELRDTCDGTVL
jgi:hypothetical protein